MAACSVSTTLSWVPVGVCGCTETLTNPRRVNDDRTRLIMYKTVSNTRVFFTYL